MFNERVFRNNIRIESLQCCVEVGYTILCEQTDEIKALNGVFPFRGREGFALNILGYRNDTSVVNNRPVIRVKSL